MNNILKALTFFLLLNQISEDIYGQDKGNVTTGANSWTFMNETKDIKFTVRLTDTKLFYNVDYLEGQHSTPVINPSPMGITRLDQNFTDSLIFVSVSEVKKGEESYKMLIGKALEIKNSYQEQIFTFKNNKGTKLQIIARTYPDGVAFRYSFPDKLNGPLKIISESTGFKIPVGGKAWLHPYSSVSQWAPSYESEWQNAIDIGKESPEVFGWAFPALFNVNNKWILLTEADLNSSYYGIHIQQKADDGLYQVRLPEANETYGVAPQEATITSPWKSPWRLAMVGKTPGTIMESNLVYNLSAPNTIKDISWIKPGRVSWSWWSDGGSPFDYNKLVPFIDLSAKLGWEYSLIDLGWHQMSNGNINQLIDYAKSKSVGLILWYNSGGKHNEVKDACPCDIMSDPLKRIEEMKKLQSWGIKGVKIDFMQSDKQYLIKLYEDILKDAAKYHLFVDFHGATIPRGWSRTYPNLLTMEAIRGAEQYWDKNFAENAHTFHTIYTFTRNVIGPMDYTPVIFGEAPQKISHQTTNAHELATSVAFESGLQHFADHAATYLKQPDYVLEFMKRVPVTWDETKYIDGRPGELTLMARRKGSDWYLAGLNGKSDSITVNVDLSFLGNGKYTLDLITDGNDSRSFANQKSDVLSKATLKVSMLGRGGFVGLIEKKNN